jgi:hypothetical protein
MLDENTPQVWRKNVDLLLEKTQDLPDKPFLEVCKGRVPNLELLVPEQWWKTVFSDSLYLKTDGDVVEDPEITSDEIKEILDIIPEIKSTLEKSNYY